MQQLWFKVQSRSFRCSQTPRPLPVLCPTTRTSTCSPTRAAVPYRTSCPTRLECIRALPQRRVRYCKLTEERGSKSKFIDWFIFGNENSLYLRGGRQYSYRKHRVGCMFATILIQMFMYDTVCGCMVPRGVAVVAATASAEANHAEK